MEPIRTCVLGTGLAGLTFHVPFILALPELFSLNAILERNPKTDGGKLQERFGVTATIYTTLDDVLNDKDIELIVIATPNETHYEFAKKSLEAGKHVLVDKPVTSTVDQAKELGELAKSKNLILYAFQNRRWDSDFLALRKLLTLAPSSPQYLGNVWEFESRFDRYRTGLKGTWKDESLPAAGQIYDLGTHLIDQALILFGRPESLTAFKSNIRGIGHPAVDDSFSIFLHYPASPNRPHPLTVILRAAILSVHSRSVRYVVRGTKGTFHKYGVDVQEDQLRAITDPTSIHESGFGREPRDIHGTIDNLQEGGQIVNNRWPPHENGSYIKLYENLAASIREGAELAVKWEEATSVIQLVELAHQSAKEGKTLPVNPL